MASIARVMIDPALKSLPMRRAYANN